MTASPRSPLPAAIAQRIGDRFSALRTLGMALLCASAAAAGDIQGLVTEGHLEVSSSISPDTGIVPGQRMTLSLEVATDTWFTGGTRISIPEVEQLVILQTEQFATNASENRKGQTWVVQRWNLDIYPQRAGTYSTGPIAMHVQVNAGTEGAVQGTLSAPAVSFRVALPEALQQAGFWVAAPSFQVEQTFDRELEGLAPGDAFERSIVFQASDVLSMMLPTFAEQAQPGLAAYPAPPQLEDNSNRGETRARRVRNISYVVEAPGEYLLPAQDYFWWDTGAWELKVISLPATEIRIASEAVADSEQRKPVLAPRQWALLAAAALLAVIAAAALWRLQPWRAAAPLLPPLQRLWRQLLDLRKPALPSRLNPGSNAGE